ncbi:MAG: hypothetical protein IJS31_01700 [Oscillospiraceae bacterium]|nr:hypothetical protein [Oscillospiraceae bacterium]
MRFKRSLLGLLLLLAMSLLLTVGALAAAPAAAGATDDQAWCSAECLHSMGIINGIGQDSAGQPLYQLGRPITREEAITVIVRLIGAEKDALEGAWDIPFEDVSDWASPYVGYAYHHKITLGTSTSRFSGSNAVSAEQYLTFLLRTLQYTDPADFTWDAPFALADRLGITYGEYANGCDFLRGDVCYVTWNAMTVSMKDGTACLAGTLRDLPAQAKRIFTYEPGFLFSWYNDAGTATYIAYYSTGCELINQYEIPVEKDGLDYVTLTPDGTSRFASPRYYYGLSGLYQANGSALTQVSKRPVCDLCFYRAGARSMGPVILTGDANAIFPSAYHSYGGDTIIELRTDLDTVSEEILVNPSSEHGIKIDDLFSSDSSVCFRAAKAQDDGKRSVCYYVLFQKYDQVSAHAYYDIFAEGYWENCAEIDDPPQERESGVFAGEKWQAETERLIALGLYHE